MLKMKRMFMILFIIAAIIMLNPIVAFSLTNNFFEIETLLDKNMATTESARTEKMLLYEKSVQDRINSRQK